MDLWMIPKILSLAFFFSALFLKNLTSMLSILIVHRLLFEMSLMTEMFRANYFSS